MQWDHVGTAPLPGPATTGAQELPIPFPFSSPSGLLYPAGVDLPLLPGRALALQLSPAAGSRVSV